MRPRQLGIPTKPTRLKTGQLANIVTSLFGFARILARKIGENLLAKSEFDGKLLGQLRVPPNPPSAETHTSLCRGDPSNSEAVGCLRRF